MSEFNAIPFSHLESLLDFVRQYGRPQAQGRYELHEGVRVRRSGEDEQSTFFLVRQDRDLPDNPSYRATTIAIDFGSSNLAMYRRFVQFHRRMGKFILQ